MSKFFEKDHQPLKFDTSSASLNCFIQANPNHSQQPHHSKNTQRKKRTRYQKQPNIEFQDKVFLQSIVSKVLADVDGPGITQLIDSMIFPSTNGAQAEHTSDNRRQQLQQQEISQIFSNSQPSNTPKHPHRINICELSKDHYRMIPPQYYHHPNQRKDLPTVLHPGYGSHPFPLRDADTNPEKQMTNSMNSLVYPYSYYNQSNPQYQRKLSPRKKRIVSCEQAQEYRIIPEKIQASCRTSLMIRHIPNKYSQDMLLQQIGKQHRQHINFLYLPIDQYNSCNVGYAFVNFIHTKFILEFYRDFNGRKWDRFNSEKICVLAYARIQGTVNLMDHFQNASNGQLRPRERSSEQLDDEAVKGVNKIGNSPRTEDN